MAVGAVPVWVVRVKYHLPPPKPFAHVTVDLELGEMARHSGGVREGVNRLWT